jgi:hypothetical protein
MLGIIPVSRLGDRAQDYREEMPREILAAVLARLLAERTVCTPYLCIYGRCPISLFMTFRNPSVYHATEKYGCI